jgi:hypothetical protein
MKKSKLIILLLFGVVVLGFILILLMHQLKQNQQKLETQIRNKNMEFFKSLKDPLLQKKSANILNQVFNPKHNTDDPYLFFKSFPRLVYSRSIDKKLYLTVCGLDHNYLKNNLDRIVSLHYVSGLALVKQMTFNTGNGCLELIAN